MLITVMLTFKCNVTLDKRTVVTIQVREIVLDQRYSEMSFVWCCLDNWSGKTLSSGFVAHNMICRLKQCRIEDNHTCVCAKAT